ncbi:MAG: hypothetical protein ACFFD2_06300, partial [Promethearchaeota archaeon]
INSYAPSISIVGSSNYPFHRMKDVEKRHYNSETINKIESELDKLVEKVIQNNIYQEKIETLSKTDP